MNLDQQSTRTVPAHLSPAPGAGMVVSLQICPAHRAPIAAGESRASALKTWASRVIATRCPMASGKCC